MLLLLIISVTSNLINNLKQINSLPLRGVFIWLPIVLDVGGTYTYENVQYSRLLLEMQQHYENSSATVTLLRM